MLDSRLTLKVNNCYLALSLRHIEVLKTSVTDFFQVAIIEGPQALAYAPVAQLDRVTGFEPVGREFESLRACHLLKLTT